MPFYDPLSATKLTKRIRFRRFWFIAVKHIVSLIRRISCGLTTIQWTNMYNVVVEPAACCATNPQQIEAGGVWVWPVGAWTCVGGRVEGAGARWLMPVGIIGWGILCPRDGAPRGGPAPRGPVADVLRPPPLATTWIWDGTRLLSTRSRWPGSVQCSIVVHIDE